MKYGVGVVVGMVLLIGSALACASDANGGDTSGAEAAHPSPAPAGGGEVVKPDVEQLRAAPEVVEIGGAPLRLEASAWVNRMPGPEPRDTSLMASVRVVPDAGGAVPAGLIIDRLWLVQGDEVWQPAHLTPGRPIPGQLQSGARGGPAWPEGAAIDVIARVRDDAGASYRLRAPRAQVTAVH